MFEKCEKCGIELKCQDEYVALNSGYWWSWRNDTHKNRYRAFIDNLVASSPALGEEDVTYPYSLPTPYQCPLKSSCQGGIDSTCISGYKGPLCSVCSQGYYKQLHKCKTCPSMAWMAAQITIIFVVLIIIAVACVWTSKRAGKKNDGERSSIDNFLSKIKIAIGFYQVTYGLLEAFSFIEWPQSMQFIGEYSEILQLNILQVAPVHCFISGIQADALEHLFTIMAINASIIVFAGVAYGVRRITITRNKTLRDDEKLKKSQKSRKLFTRMCSSYCTLLISAPAPRQPLSCRLPARNFAWMTRKSSAWNTRIRTTAFSATIPGTKSLFSSPTCPRSMLLPSQSRHSLCSGETEKRY